MSLEMGPRESRCCVPFFGIFELITYLTQMHESGPVSVGAAGCYIARDDHPVSAFGKVQGAKIIHSAHIGR